MSVYPVVEFIKTEDGNLRIELLPEEREEVEEIARRDGGIDEKFLDIIEYQLCNGWCVIKPEQVASLTASIILSDSAVFSEDEEDEYGNEKLLYVGTVYWNPKYAVQDEVELLLTQGYVEFVGVNGNE